MDQTQTEMHDDEQDQQSRNQYDMPQSLASSLHQANKQRIAQECMAECQQFIQQQAKDIITGSMNLQKEGSSGLTLNYMSSSLNQVEGAEEPYLASGVHEQPPLQYSSLANSKTNTLQNNTLQNMPTFKTKDKRMLMMSSGTRDMLTAYADEFTGE